MPSVRRLADLSKALVGVWMCACTTPPATTEVPAKQFVARGLRLQEVQAGRVIWTGTIARADGDLRQTEVHDIEIRGEPEPGGRRLQLFAPRGFLDFDAGVATFERVRLVDDAGGVLTADTAYYDSHTKTIDARGPIEIAARGLNVTATSGVIDLATGTISLRGPIKGRWER